MKKGTNSYFLVIQNAKRFVIVNNYLKKKLQKKKKIKRRLACSYHCSIVID